MLGCVCVALLLHILRNPLAMNHDVAALLQMSKMMVQGATPYLDFNCFNPPMIIYMGMVPALLAQLLSVHIIPVFTLLVFLLAVWSTLTIWYLLYKAQPATGILGSTLIPLFFMGLTFVFPMHQSEKKEGRIEEHEEVLSLSELVVKVGNLEDECQAHEKKRDQSAPQYAGCGLGLV